MILRALEIGLKLDDLNEITIGELMDILLEKQNDSVEYPQIATKEDFMRF